MFCLLPCLFHAGYDLVLQQGFDFNPQRAVSGNTDDEIPDSPSVFFEMTHPDDLGLDLVRFREMAAGGLDAYTVEKRFLHASGEHVWAKLTLSVVRDPSARSVIDWGR